MRKSQPASPGTGRTRIPEGSDHPSSAGQRCFRYNLIIISASKAAASSSSPFSFSAFSAAGFHKGLIFKEKKRKRKIKKLTFLFFAKESSSDR